MWFANANRKLLLDLIQSRKPFSLFQFRESEVITTSTMNPSEDLLFIWQERPTIDEFLPNIICVPDDKYQELLSWVSTYISIFKPFTAFCRIIEESKLKLLISKRFVPKLGDLQSMYVGVILGEAFTHIANKDIKKLTPLAIMSTYSFAICRGYALEYYQEIDEISNRWIQARLMTKQTKYAFDINRNKKIWLVIDMLIHQRDTDNYIFDPELILIYEACMDILKNGFIDNQRLNHMFKLSGFTNINDQMKDTRENRVVFFEKIVPSLIEQKNQATSSFLCAYLASQIAPGILNYTDLLYPYLSFFPDVLIWYGLCTGLYPDTEILSYNEGLGNRITRDLLLRDSIFERPKYDITYDELRVLTNVDKPLLDFRTENHTHLLVELCPSINTILIWFHPEAIEKKVEKNLNLELDLDLNKKEYYDENELLIQLGRAIMLTNDLYQRYYKSQSKSKTSNYYSKDSKVNKKKPN